MSDGEAKTEAREGRERLCCASHGELQLWRGTVAAETKIAATTLVRRPNSEVEKLKEATVDLWASWSEVRHDGE